MRISEGSFRNIQQLISTQTSSTPAPSWARSATKTEIDEEAQVLVKQKVLQILQREYGSSFSPRKIDLPSIRLSGRLPESPLIPSVRIWMSWDTIGPCEEIIPQVDPSWDHTLTVFGAMSSGPIICLNLYAVDSVKPFLYESEKSVASHIQQYFSPATDTPEEEYREVQKYLMVSFQNYDWMYFSDPQHVAVAMDSVALSQHECALKRLPRQVLAASLDHLPLLNGTPLLVQLKACFKRDRISDLARCPESVLLELNFTPEQIEDIKRSLALLGLGLGMGL